MAITVAAAFNEFNTAITPGEAVWGKVYERRDAVVNTLKSAFPSTSDIRYQSHKIIGSLGRKTASAPVADIDLLVHLSVDSDLWNRKYRSDSSEFLYRVRRSLNSASTVRKIGARGQAVRLFYADGLEVDVAAVEKYQGGSFAIPDGSGKWLTTNPNRHESYLDDRNRELAGDLKKIIRFAKQWNKAHSSYLASFHLEMMVARTFSSLNNDSRDALRVFFEHNKNYLSVQDPAGYSGDLSDYLTPLAAGAARSALDAAYRRAVAAKQAEADGNHREAIRLWRVILGNQFPVFG
ncbi:hypothetical protein ACFVDH_02985 [Streptomyces sp. NPDC057674]|uniref:SMODS domain-containing nucleotidyltransferase n=1 Tax=Streptomyces sp. NPDC057674 TaxID=3346203 RepID=UPI0036949067